jgi:hypothetical protein
MQYSRDDELKIRERLAKIDNIFKSECVFCGSVLLDMIDNDIEEPS